MPQKVENNVILWVVFDFFYVSLLSLYDKIIRSNIERILTIKENKEQPML
ncbi:hypothetical protein HMPREF0653_00922 [Prevotella disiens JCM 6334 = ATCC 29426]|uniref:Uncharacterized protein n=1 Tax=Prevotella disiens JCM 6334 = ATCC 29426 TaxID=1235811 RepID=A0ABP2Y8M0_9BACT|nr:hypothetical protein HMPREF0653_00922 [Prevotella disiens JCM 6334 = ATCC 29426]